MNFTFGNKGADSKGERERRNSASQNKIVSHPRQGKGNGLSRHLFHREWALKTKAKAPLMTALEEREPPWAAQGASLMLEEVT